MKGILLKELYLLKKHCGIPLFCLLLFLVMAGGTMGEQSFMVFFPFMYASIIPVTPLSYDEMHKWDEYARIFPYTPAKLVLSKYLVGGVLQIAVTLILLIISAVKMAMAGEVQVLKLVAMAGLGLLIGAAFGGFNLPFMFRFGVSKGRIAYYATLALSVGGCLVASAFFDVSFSPEIVRMLSVGMPVLWLIPLFLAPLLYVGSYYLSVALYKKRYR
ncbi:MAG: ABC-2 transporter permease [Clostridia bacterium]|nr:ABC-2 transporter permease [Clostridia bacterium]